MGVEDRIKRHEGFSIDPYRLSYKRQDGVKVVENFYTGGWGHKMSIEEYMSYNYSWTDEEKKEYWNKLFDKDFKNCVSGLEEIEEEYKMNLNQIQKEIIIEMIYQMGKSKVRKFRSFLKALSQSPPDTEEAYWQMITKKGRGSSPSVWFLKTPKRVKELSDIMRTSNGYS